MDGGAGDDATHGRGAVPAPAPPSPPEHGAATPRPAPAAAGGAGCSLPAPSAAACRRSWPSRAARKSPSHCTTCQGVRQHFNHSCGGGFACEARKALKVATLLANPLKHAWSNVGRCSGTAAQHALINSASLGGVCKGISGRRPLAKKGKENVFCACVRACVRACAARENRRARARARTHTHTHTHTQCAREQKHMRARARAHAHARTRLHPHPHTHTHTHTHPPTHTQCSVPRFTSPTTAITTLTG
jgi:hypothetical protein